MKKISIFSNASELLKMISVVFSCFIFFSCHKNDFENGTKDYIQDESFFKRTSTSSDMQHGSQNIKRTEAENIKINKAILYFKEFDKAAKISNKIKEHLGNPIWNASMILKNENGSETIITPIVNNNAVSSIIFSYENNNGRIVFKIVDRNNKQEKLKEHGNKEATQFTKASLLGIFKNLDRITGSVIEQNGKTQVNSVEKTTNSIIINWGCWNYTWAYTDADGGVVVGATYPQCSYSISISFSDLASLDGGGGWTPPGGSSDGSIVIQPILYNVNNKITTPCLTSVANKIGNANFVDTLSNIFRNTFINTGSANNLIFQEAIFLGIAQSYYDPNNSNTWIVELNTTSFQGASQEYIASILAHEIEHYYISEYFNQQGMSWSTNFMQHDFMFRNWVNASRNILVSMFNMSAHDATALALGGMDDVVKSVLGSSFNSAQLDGFNSFYNTFAQNNYGMSLADPSGIRALYSTPTSTGYAAFGTKGC